MVAHHACSYRYVYWFSGSGPVLLDFLGLQLVCTCSMGVLTGTGETRTWRVSRLENRPVEHGKRLRVTHSPNVGMRVLHGLKGTRASVESSGGGCCCYCGLLLKNAQSETFTMHNRRPFFLIFATATHAQHNTPMQNVPCNVHLHQTRGAKLINVRKSNEAQQNYPSGA